MKIATWNIDRLKSKKNIFPIVECIQKIDADILILTEYNSILELPFYEYKSTTEQLPEVLIIRKKPKDELRFSLNFRLKKALKRMTAKLLVV